MHHSTIKDLQRQVIQMHRKIAVVDNSENLHGPPQLLRRYLGVGSQKKSNNRALTKGTYCW